MISLKYSTRYKGRFKIFIVKQQKCLSSDIALIYYANSLLGRGREPPGTLSWAVNDAGARTAGFHQQPKCNEDGFVIAVGKDAVEQILGCLLSVVAARPRCTRHVEGLALLPLADDPHVAVLLALRGMVVSPEQHTVVAGVVRRRHAVLHAQAGRATRNRAHVGLVGHPVSGCIVAGCLFCRRAWHVEFQKPRNRAGLNRRSLVSQILVDLNILS